jgi:integrase
MATVQFLFELFIADVAETKSAATLVHYTKRLKPFVKRFGDREISELQPIEIKAYVNELNRFQAPHKKAGQLKASATRASNVVVLQLLQAFTIDLRVLSAPFLPKLDVPVGARRSTLPTAEQVQVILRGAGRRFKLIYRGLRQSGARPSELVRATIADWHRAEKEIVLTYHKTAEATGEIRRIGVGHKLQQILESSTKGRTEGPLFLNVYGAAWTVNAVSRTFSKLRDKAGIPKSIVLYTARHEHATLLCEKVGLDEAADALNHKSINTTRHYVHKKKQKLLDNQDLMDDAGEADELPPPA